MPSGLADLHIPRSSCGTQLLRGEASIPSETRELKSGEDEILRVRNTTMRQQDVFRRSGAP